MLHWNGDFDNPNDIEDDVLPDVESDIEQDNGINDLESPEQQDMSTTPNFHRLIRPIRKSKRQAEKFLVMVIAMEMTRNKAILKN